MARFLAQFADPLVYLLIAAVIVSLVAWLLEGADGVPFEVIVILAIIMANAVLGYVQEALGPRRRWRRSNAWPRPRPA